MLIDQGGYGCIYEPSINCDGTMNKDGVSKIVNSQVASREIEISNLIKKIPHYLNYFSPIESHCKIKSSKIKKKCTALYNETNFIIMNKPYIKTVDVSIDVTTFLDMLPHITKLIKAKIVHFDIKEDNVLFTPKPLLIDFGISFSMKKVKSNLSSYFYVYSPYQYEWPIDVHLLCFLINHKWTSSSLTKVCNEVYKHSPVLKNATECIQHYSYLNTCSKHDAIQSLLQGWKTWDMYALTVMLFMHKKVPALSLNFHPDPTKRLSPRASRLAAGLTTTAPATAYS
jgi:hypothetical protein